MCLKLLSKLLTKKDDMPKPNDFVYSSDYRQPYIYEVIEGSITAPASSNTAPVYNTKYIPHNYTHMPLILGYTSADPNFADKHPINGVVYTASQSQTIDKFSENTYSMDASSYIDKFEIRARTDMPSMPAKTLYYRLFLINRVDDSIPGKRQIVPKGNFNLNSDLTNIQIYKEGRFAIPAGQTSGRVTHDLGYPPLVLCWDETNYYPAHPDWGNMTSEVTATSTKDYIEVSWEYPDTRDSTFYYMILTERIPDGQSS